MKKRKQGQSPASMRSQSSGHLRLLFFWSGREFFAPPVFLPQTWTATSGAQYCCADALHSADMLLIPYSGPFCHHGCRALHHKASSQRSVPAPHQLSAEERAFVACRACNWRSDPLSLPPRFLRIARSPCVCPVISCRSCVKLRRRQRSFRTG